jgi:hypothetical protein
MRFFIELQVVKALDGHQLHACGKFFESLDFDQICLFLDGHDLLILSVISRAEALLMAVSKANTANLNS